MFRKNFIILIILGTMLLSACSTEKTEQKVDKTVPVANEVTNNNATLELSAKEKEAYSNFQKDFNLKHLSALKPISIAKLYVKAGFDKDYDVQYALYTDREEYVQWSKEEDQKIPASDRGTEEQNIKQFENIDKGKFVQTSDYEGYIQYQSAEGTQSFNMIKNEDGTWQVAFLPIQ